MAGEALPCSGRECSRWPDWVGVIAPKPRFCKGRRAGFRGSKPEAGPKQALLRKNPTCGGIHNRRRAPGERMCACQLRYQRLQLSSLPARGNTLGKFGPHQLPAARTDPTGPTMLNRLGRRVGDLPHLMAPRLGISSTGFRRQICVAGRTRGGSGVLYIGGAVFQQGLSGVARVSLPEDRHALSRMGSLVRASLPTRTGERWSG